MRRAEFIKKFFIYFFLIIGSLIMLFPFYWMLSSAAKTYAEYASFPPRWWPQNWFNFSNYVNAFSSANFVTYFKNSFIVVIASVGVNNLIKARVDMNKTRNLIISSIILTVGIGGAVISFGKFSLAGIGLASIVGVILNLIIPDKEKDTENVES